MIEKKSVDFSVTVSLIPPILAIEGLSFSISCLSLLWVFRLNPMQ